MPLSTIFQSYTIIVVVSFIGGGNRSTRKNHWPVANHWQTLSHMVYRVHLTWAGLKLTTLMVIGTDCIGSCKSNYHTINTTKVPTSKMLSAEQYYVCKHFCKFQGSGLKNIGSWLDKISTLVKRLLKNNFKNLKYGNICQ
jgi:hypothetical protein